MQFKAYQLRNPRNKQRPLKIITGFDGPTQLQVALHIAMPSNTCVWQQLHWTLCCTSIAHREHKQRQQNMSESNHVPGRAITLFPLM